MIAWSKYWYRNRKWAIGSRPIELSWRIKLDSIRQCRQFRSTSTQCRLSRSTGDVLRVLSVECVQGVGGVEEAKRLESGVEHLWGKSS